MINRFVTFLVAFFSLIVLYFVALIFQDLLVSIAIVFPILFSIVIGLQVETIRILKRK